MKVLACYLLLCFFCACNNGVNAVIGLIPVELIDGENQSLNKAMEELGLLKKQGTVRVVLSS